MSGQVLLTRLKDVRTKIGLTQDDVARMADITSRTVQRIEAGQPTSVSTAKSISAALMLSSYSELTSETMAGQDLSKTDFSSKQKINDIKAQLVAFNVSVIKNRVAWVLSFAAIIMLCLTLPTGLFGEEHEIPTFMLVVCALLPTLVMLVLTYEPEPPTGTHRYSIAGAAMVCMLSAIGTLFSAWFAVISYMMVFETSSVRHILRQPVPDSWLSMLSNLNGAPWAFSFIMMALSLAVMTWLVYWLRRRGVHFSRFSPACLCFMAMLVPAGFVLESVLLEHNRWLVIPMSVIVMLLAAVLVVIMEKKEAGGWPLFKVSVLSGMGFLLVSATFVQTLNWVVVNQVMFYRAAEVSSESKVAYCAAYPENTLFCWDVRLLEQEGIAVTPAHLTILMARNGQGMSLMHAADMLQINEAKLKTEAPFPDAFYQLNSEGHFRMMSHAKKHGDLYDLIMQGQNETRNDEGVKSRSEHLFRLGDGVDEYVTLIGLAKEDKLAFVSAFENAHPVVKMNADLRTLYFLATGKSERKHEDKRYNYYSAGKAFYLFKKSNGEQDGEKVSLSDIEVIMKIPSSKLPAI